MATWMTADQLGSVDLLGPAVTPTFTPVYNSGSQGGFLSGVNDFVGDALATWMQYENFRTTRKLVDAQARQSAMVDTVPRNNNPGAVPMQEVMPAETPAPAGRDYSGLLWLAAAWLVIEAVA